MTIVVAIDGPAGSGKGTIAKKISSFYKFPHLDSGILYRSVAYLCQTADEIDFSEENVLRHARKLNLDEIDVGNLRTKEIDDISSKISSFKSLREFLKSYQLDFKKIHPSGNLSVKLKTVSDLMITGKKLPIVSENMKMKKTKI